MSDGRMFTDYGSRCDMNASKTQESSKTKNMDSYSYRQYLVANADALLAEMRSKAYASGRCGPCEEPFAVGTMLPEKEIDVCDASTCTRQLIGDGSGVGLGRFYSLESSTNDEYTKFKENEQKELRAKANCCGTPGDYDNYYGMSDLKQFN